MKETAQKHTGGPRNNALMCKIDNVMTEFCRQEQIYIKVEKSYCTQKGQQFFGGVEKSINRSKETMEIIWRTPTILSKVENDKPRIGNEAPNLLGKSTKYGPQGNRPFPGEPLEISEKPNTLGKIERWCRNSQPKK